MAGISCDQSCCVSCGCRLLPLELVFGEVSVGQGIQDGFFTHIPAVSLSPCCISLAKPSPQNLGFSHYGGLLEVTLLNWLPSQKVETSRPVNSDSQNRLSSKSSYAIGQSHHIACPVQRVDRDILSLDRDQEHITEECKGREILL